MRTGVVGWLRVNVRALPAGKANLSLLKDTTTLTGNGAEESTDTGMEAVREVKVMVLWAARETRLTSTPKRWTKTASAAARWAGSNDRFSEANRRSESSTNTAGC